LISLKPELQTQEAPEAVEFAGHEVPEAPAVNCHASYAPYPGQPDDEYQISTVDALAFLEYQLAAGWTPTPQLRVGCAACTCATISAAVPENDPY
jgi:hypothetical protein